MTILEAGLSPVVPRGWSVVPLLGVVSETATPNAGMREGNLLSLSYGNIVRKDIDTTDGLLPATFETYQIVEPGDIILRLTDLQNDKRSLRTGRAVERGIITSAYVAIRPGSSVDSRFLHYSLHSLDLRKVFYSLGGGLRQSITFEELRRLPVAVPPLVEQRHIADYLDAETFRIDGLISARRRQATLLQERQLEIVRQATTAPSTQDAEHQQSADVAWRVMKVAHVFETGSGTTPKSDVLEYFDGDINWVNSGDVRDGPILETHKKVTDLALRDYSALKVFQRGALVIAMYGQGATKGRVGVLQQAACVNQACCVLLPSSVVLSDWAALWFRANKPDIVDLALGAGQPNLSQELIRSLRLPVPPLPEQHRLLTMVAAEASVSERFIARLQESIALLEERRRALITAAVTGGFEVPGAAA